jgi:exonuclease III
MESQLRTGTYNINGLLSPRKQNSLIQTMLGERLDVICIQETHITTPGIAKRIKDTLKCDALWNLAPSNRSGGTAILIFNIQHTIQKYFFNLDGSLIVLDLIILGKPLRIINTYAPNNEAERKQFFVDLAPHLTCNRGIILCGDFNCVMNSKIDKIGGDPMTGMIGSNEIKQLTYDFHISDIYRYYYPTTIMTS